MNQKVLTIFLDGLKYNSLKYMPFLNSFRYKARLKTLLGYSLTCHATMYTGVYPDKHNYWFVWKNSPHTSPFKKIVFLKYFPFCNILPIKLLIHKVITFFNRDNTSFFGIPKVVHLPVKYWNYIDVTEKKNYCEEKYIEKYPTIFDILRKEKIDFIVIGMDKSEKEESKIVRKYSFTSIPQWSYLFMGDIDHFSHTYLQDSKEGQRRLKKLDKLIELKYQEFSKNIKNFHFIVFSDHGHIPVHHRINIYDVYKKNKINLNDFFHIIDVNFLRIWVNNKREKKILENILINNLKGFLIKSQELEKYHLPKNNNEYGDIIFYLDAPYIFSNTIWGYSRKIISMHGYLPEYADSNGVFISNLPIKKKDVKLIDILPSHLELLNVDIPGYVDGESVWS